MAEAKGHAKLGNYVFRLDPDQINYEYSIDYSVINTLGGQVIQVLGTTLGDMTITGSFGQDHSKGNPKESWEMANSFHVAIKKMIDGQLVKPGENGSHQPIRFTYQDGTHNWNFLVLIKGISDPDAPGSAIEYTNGKMNYRWQLTLFIVQDSSRALKNLAEDKFIARVSNGLGWKANRYNGRMTTAAALQWITDNSPDGTVAGLLAAQLKEKSDAAAAAASGTDDDKLPTGPTTRQKPS